MSDADKTWPSWTDHLGQVYGAGDYVAIATINGKSPQLIIARVERINRLNSKGQEIEERKGFWLDGQRQYRTEPSATISARPVLAGRGFTRYADRLNTYQFPGNIVKVPTPPGF